MEKSQKRLDYIDIARGIGILSIVYGHASRDQGVLSQAVYSFHVVLCVLLSGYVYRQKDSFREHLRKSSFRLLLPYFVWSLISMVIYLLLGKIAAEALGSEVYSLRENVAFVLRGLSIGNAALWYLPFLFTAGVLMYAYCRFWEKHQGEKKPLPVILLPVLFSVGTLALYSRFQYEYPIDFPFGINNACFLFVFFFLGFALRKRDFLPEKKIYILPACLLVLASIACALHFNDEVEYMSFDHSEYGRNIYVFFLTASLTSFGILWISKILGRCRVLQWFGRNSMAILVMHKFPVLFFQVLLGDLGETLGGAAWIFYLLITLAAASMCCAVGWFLKKYLPWTLGEHKKTAA